MNREIIFKVIDVPPENLPNRKITLIGYEALIEGTWRSIDAGKSINWSKARYGSYSGFYWKRLQYTGLKDKNGIELYEGDIVIMHDFGMHGTKASIFWNERECGWYYQPVSELDYARPLLGPIIDVNGKKHKGHSIEVIGNIYENSELI